MNFIPYNFGNLCPVSAILNRHRLENRRALQRLKEGLPDKFNAEFKKDLSLNKARPGHLTQRHQTADLDKSTGIGNGAYSSLLEAIGHKYEPLFQPHNKTAIFREPFTLPTISSLPLGKDPFMVN